MLRSILENREYRPISNPFEKSLYRNLSVSKIFCTMLNVLVIGPTGYVGSSAVGHLFRAGNHQIFGLAETTLAGYRLAAKVPSGTTAGTTVFYVWQYTGPV